MQVWDQRRPDDSTEQSEYVMPHRVSRSIRQRPRMERAERSTEAKSNTE
jgi:hypothetical protein